MKMTNAAMIALNHKYDNINYQNTMISIAVIEKNLDVAEIQTHLELILKVQDKSEKYYKFVSEEVFEQTEGLLSQLFYEIQINLKISINKI